MIDLTGLQPIRDRSRQLLDASFSPTGGVDEDEYNRLINQKLWGTGTSPGLYSALASRGIRPGSEIPPELNYSTSRSISDSIQELADRYANRQRSAIETARTSEMVEPTFRLQEANVTGLLEGVPTESRRASQAQEALQAGSLTGLFQGAPTLAREQMDIDRLLREAGITGVYGGQPTLAGRELAFRTGPEFALREREVQGRLTALVNDMDFRNKLLQIQMAQGIGAAVGSIAQALGVPQIAGDLLRQVIGLPPTNPTSAVGPQAIQVLQQLLGGATPGLVPLTSGQQATEQLLATQAAQAELAALGGGDGGGGAGGGVAGAAAGPAAALIAKLLASEAPAAAIPMTSVAPAAALPDMSLWPAIPSAGVGTLASGGVGAAAPSIEAGLVEMLGPELAAQLGYTAAPAIGAASVGTAGAGAAGVVGATLPMSAAALEAAPTWAALGLGPAALAFLPVAAAAATGLYFTQWGKSRDAKAQNLANMAIGGQLQSAQTPQDLANIATWTFHQSGEQWRYQRELIDSVAQSLYGSTGAPYGFYGQAYPGYAKALEAAFPGSNGGLTVQPRMGFGAPGEALMTEWLRSYIGMYGDLPSPTAFTDALRQYYEPVPVSPSVVAAQQMLGLPPSATIDPVILANIERMLYDTGK